MDRLSASQEDYLEAIFHLCDEHRVARVRDIAGRLGVRCPSVTGALQALAGRQLVNYEPYGLVTLTPAGEAEAAGVVRRHEALRRFLEAVLGISGAEAETGACRMEHELPPLVQARLALFVQFVEQCPGDGCGWLPGFRALCDHGEPSPTCQACRRRAGAAAAGPAVTTEPAPAARPRTRHRPGNGRRPAPPEGRTP